MKKIIAINTLVLFSFLFGFYTSYRLGHKLFPENFSESRATSNPYHYINPLLECDDDAVSHETNLDKLRSQISKYIDTEISQKNIILASVYYRDMNNGPWFGIHEKENFSPSSLIKIPLMITYFRLAESDPNILLQKLIINHDTGTQNIVPEVTLVPDQKYSVSDLINQMIIHSDNTAYNTLLNSIDNRQLVQTYTDLGIDISKGFDDPTGDIISVKSYASFFRILYNASYLNKEYSEKSLEILSQSRFFDGLVAGISPQIKIAHKFGERRFTERSIDQLHDCGIVYIPGKPYLICVMTRGLDFGKLEAVIKNISRQIYDFVK